MSRIVKIAALLLAVGLWAAANAAEGDRERVGAACG
jgi:hypothetical protein